MDAAAVLSIANWPQKVGTDWYAIGGAIGISALVIIALLLLNFFSSRQSHHD